MTAFLWLTGMENSALPDLGVDELELTGHYDRLEEDFALARDSGARGVRYGLPWDRLEPKAGAFDWTLSDRAVAAAVQGGLELLWDLVHFGSPSWLGGGFLDPGYPAAVARYARAFADRYPGVTRYTPFNEPYIGAYFRGGNGTWPPYETTLGGFVRQLVPVVEGLRQTIRALREGRPGVQIWLNDGADTFRPEPGLEALAAELESLRFLPLDLLLGRVASGSPAWAQLADHGAPTGWLADCRAHPVDVAVVGLDYYPGSEHTLHAPVSVRDPGDWSRRTDFSIRPDRAPRGLGAALKTYFLRYHKPLYVAETSSVHAQGDWLRYALGEVAWALDAGIPVAGFTWWPLFDHVDWDSGLTRRRGHVSPSGLWHGTPTARDREEGSLVPAFRRAVASSPRSADRVPFPLASLGPAGGPA